MENEIRAEFSQRMEHVQRKIIEYKAKQSAGIHSLMVKAGGARNMELLTDVFGIWRQDCFDEKDIRDAQSKAAQLDEKVREMKNNYRRNMMKFLARMNNKSEDEVLVTALGAWLQVYQDWKNLSANEKEQALAQEKMAKIMAEKKDGTAKVLGALTAGQAGACVKMTFDAWKECWDDAKREAAIAEALAQAEMKMGNFNSKNKASSMGVQERAAYMQDMQLYMQVFNAWKLDTRMEKTLAYHGASIDSKRQQLVMVQQMFRNFAVQLESGLKDDNSGRTFDNSSGRKKKMSKGEGSVSLPDINQGRTTPK